MSVCQTFCATLWPQNRTTMGLQDLQCLIHEICLAYCCQFLWQKLQVGLWKCMKWIAWERETKQSSDLAPQIGQQFGGSVVAGHNLCWTIWWVHHLWHIIIFIEVRFHLVQSSSSMWDFILLLFLHFCKCEIITIWLKHWIPPKIVGSSCGYDLSL